MSMTKRDFEAIAGALSSIRPEPESPERPMWDACKVAVGDGLRQSNPYFDRERFDAWAEGVPELGRAFGPKRAPKDPPRDPDDFGPESEP